jgi:hypothetical protein
MDVEDAKKEKTPGFILLFAKLTFKTSAKQTVIAYVTHGHYHVETISAWRVWDSTQKRLLYEIGEIPSRFTTSMGGKWVAQKEIPENYFQNPEKQWDMLFIPVAGLAERNAAVEWAIMEDGVPYNYTNALLSPFRSADLTRMKDTDKDSLKSALFCSQAAVIMMQKCHPGDNYFHYINTETITPAYLYSILYGREDVDIISKDSITFQAGFEFSKKHTTEHTPPVFVVKSSDSWLHFFFPLKS